MKYRKMDGLKFLGIIKNMEKAKDIPIIALTANAMTGDRERCLDTGSAAYPANPSILTNLAGPLPVLYE